MKYEFTPKGVCSNKICFELDGNTVKNVSFTGGCNGNLKAISRIVDGMPAEKVIEAFSGIKCGFKNTSCSDQFASALKQALQK